MPRQLKEILHAKGISLVGALAAAGILGGLAMVFAQLTKQQMQAQKRAETGVEIVALSQRVVRTLYDGKACINTLGAGKNIAPGAFFDLDAIKNKDDQIVYQALTADPNAPSYGNRLLKVASLKLVVNTNPNPIPGDQAGAMLEVTLQKISSAYTGQIETVKKFPVTLELDTAKKLVGCVSDISAVADPVKEAICKEIGGTTAWDTTTKTCTFGACQSGEYLEGFDTSGKVCKTLPQIADMACTQQGWAVTKFQNGVPVCEEVIPPAPAPQTLPDAVAPTVTISASATSPSAGDTVTLTANTSGGTYDGALTYDWMGNGLTGSTTGSSTDVTLASAGTANVTVEVTATGSGTNAKSGTSDMAQASLSVDFSTSTNDYYDVPGKIYASTAPWTHSPQHLDRLAQKCKTAYDHPESQVCRNFFHIPQQSASSTYPRSTYDNYEKVPSVLIGTSSYTYWGIYTHWKNYRVEWTHRAHTPSGGNCSKATPAGVPCVPFSGAGTDYCYVRLVACDSSSVTRIGGTP